MKFFSMTIGLFLFFLFPVTSQCQTYDQEAESILKKVDEIRSPGANFIFTVQVKLDAPDAQPNIFEVRVRESTKSIVLYQQPVKQRGRALLLDGDNMWIFIPGTSRPLRISPQQQLLGGVSYADVARVVFSLDYRVIQKEDEQTGPILHLEALNPKIPYRFITLSLSQDMHPLRADFFSISKKLLRTAYYEDYQNIQGALRPMRIRIISSIDLKQNATMSYSNFIIKETPLEYYQPSYLSRIR